MKKLLLIIFLCSFFVKVNALEGYKFNGFVTEKKEGENYLYEKQQMNRFYKEEYKNIFYDETPIPLDNEQVNLEDRINDLSIVAENVDEEDQTLYLTIYLKQHLYINNLYFQNVYTMGNIISEILILNKNNPVNYTIDNNNFLHDENNEFGHNLNNGIFECKFDNYFSTENLNIIIYNNQLNDQYFQMEMSSLNMNINPIFNIMFKSFYKRPNKLFINFKTINNEFEYSFMPFTMGYSSRYKHYDIEKTYIIDSTLPNMEGMKYDENESYYVLAEYEKIPTSEGEILEDANNSETTEEENIDEENNEFVNVIDDVIKENDEKVPINQTTSQEKETFNTLVNQEKIIVEAENTEDKTNFWDNIEAKEEKRVIKSDKVKLFITLSIILLLIIILLILRKVSSKNTDN